MNPTDPQQMHGYAYANHNPTTWSDPTGLIPVAGNDVNDVISSGSTCTTDGRYCGGHPLRTKRPTDFGPKDDEFPYDPNAKPTKEDWQNRVGWLNLLRGCTVLASYGYDRCADMRDALQAYEHYWYGGGKDLQINLGNGYEQDSNIRRNVDDEIARSQAAAAELIDLSGWSSFGMNGKATDIKGQPETENWQKTLGEYSIWSGALVETHGDHIIMTIIPTDQRIVSETAAKWQSADKEVVVDQTVIAYDRPIGAQARAEAKIALTCKSYTAMERVFEQVALVDLPDTSELSFCEWVRPNDPRGGGVDRAAWLCTLIVGEDDLACSVRAWADERPTALATIQSLRSLAVMKCRHGT